MKTIFNLFFLFLICNFSFAQSITFEKYYDTLGCYYGNCVQQTLDGGYVLCGSNYTLANAQDVAIIKTDSLGNITWVKVYGGPNTDGALYIEQTKDSGYIVTGIKDDISASACNIWLLKLDESGDTVWTKEIKKGDKRNYANCVQQTFDGGYIITGYTSGTGIGSYDVCLIKTNSSGDTLWSKNFGGINADVGYAIRQANDSGYIIVGNTGSFGVGGGDVYMIKTNSIGDSLWTRTFGDTGGDIGESVEQTTDGGFIIGGFTWNLSVSNYNFYLIKTDSLGDAAWEKKYGGSISSAGYSVKQTIDGGYIFAGTIAVPPSNLGNVYLIKINSIGDTIWSKQYGGSAPDLCYSLSKTNDGGYILTGESKSHIPNAVYLIKTDSLGLRVIGIDEPVQDKTNLSAFPNPSNGKFMVEFWDLNISTKSVEVFNILGERVYLFNAEYRNQKYEMGLEIDLGNCPNGIYLLNVKSDVSIVSKKIIINH